MAKKKKKSGAGGLLWKLTKWVLMLGIIGALCGAAGVAGIFYYYGHDLPDIVERKDYEPKQMSRVYSADGELIAEFARPGGRRTVVPIDELPAHVRQSFMAAEDADFLEHEGIDYWGMMRAFYRAIVHNQRIKGTSTITQQVVKNLVLAPERTVERKVKEIILARELERNLSKQDILFLYMNHVYLGQGVNGIEEAARIYFGKPAKELTIAEAATISGLLPAPAKYNPLDHPDNAAGRRSYVLDQLWEKGFIEEAAYREAKEQEVETTDYYADHPHLGAAKYFVEHVRRDLVERFGQEKLYEGGLRVHTTLDVEKHATAKKAAREGLHTYDKRREYYEPVKQLEEQQLEGFVKARAKKIGQEPLDTASVYRAVVTEVDDAAEDDDEKVALKLGDRPARLILEPKARILRGAQKVSEVLQRGDVLEVVPQASKIDEHGSIPVAFDTGPQTALVSIDHATRNVVTLVGGYDYEHNQYNHATQMRRQTGSTFKPFVYGTALEGSGKNSQPITPATVFMDSPTVFQMHGGETWSPKNSDKSWRGSVRLREGLGASRNVVAVRVLKEVGIDAAKDFARRLGVRSKMVDNYTMVMGSSELTPLELVNAYATVASGGIYAEPRFLTKVESVHGETQTFNVEKRRVLAPDVSFLLTDLMTSVVEGYIDHEGRRRGGTAHSLSKLTQTVAGKTGTTNDTRDGWFVGFTPQLTTGVWVGFDDNRSLGPKEYGGRVAGPIWLEYMQKTLGDSEPHDFEPPTSGVVKATIDPETGKLARESDGGFAEYFLSGTAPTEYAPREKENSDENFLMDQFKVEGPKKTKDGAQDEQRAQ